MEINRDAYPRLKELMKQGDVTSRKLAILIKVLPACFSNRTTGKTDFTLPECAKIAGFFGKDVEEVFGGGKVHFR